MNGTWHEGFADSPPFAHYRPWAAHLAGADWPSLTKLDALAREQDLRNARGLPVRFVAQSRRCGQRDYETSILDSGQVPTREGNWHDLLNALVWLAWPRTKAALNHFQCRQLAAGQPRSPASDAATLFDESGLLLAGPDPSLPGLLTEHHWGEAFLARRGAWADMEARVVGHALLEKLLHPWPAITAKCLYLRLDETDPGRVDLDGTLAAFWAEKDEQQAAIRPAELFPVPVLGIPGWWPDNEDPGFYADVKVFRPAPA